MKIERLIAREIFDSRACPTIECTLVLEEGVSVTASVPSGMSCSEFEMVQLRDGGKRLMGQGVTKAVDLIESVIAPVLIGKEPDVVSMDVMMLEIDGTDQRSYLGANTILAVSMAVIKAQAVIDGLELYEMVAHLCGMESVSLPIPMFNMINGGVHAYNDLKVQEFLILPTEVASFRASMEAAVIFFDVLKEIVLKKKRFLGIGDEGGVSADFKDEDEVFEILMQAIEQANKRVNARFLIALDVASSQFYDKKKKKYSWPKKTATSDHLIEYYQQLINQYPIYSIEDGLSQHDIAGWQVMTKELGDKVQLVGDDIFATHPERIWQGIEQGIATAAIIKPNQIGTVTETLQAIKLCKDSNFNVVVSHRSGETNDPFIADLAVGTSSAHIKAGGVCRGERLAKYNQLITIEDSLVLSLMGM